MLRTISCVLLLLCAPLTHSLASRSVGAIGDGYHTAANDNETGGDSHHITHTDVDAGVRTYRREMHSNWFSDAGLMSRGCALPASLPVGYTVGTCTQPMADGDSCQLQMDQCYGEMTVAQKRVTCVTSDYGSLMIDSTADLPLSASIPPSATYRVPGGRCLADAVTTLPGDDFTLGTCTSSLSHGSSCELGLATPLYSSSDLLRVCTDGVLSAAPTLHFACSLANAPAGFLAGTCPVSLWVAHGASCSYSVSVGYTSRSPLEIHCDDGNLVEVGDSANLRIYANCGYDETMLPAGVTTGDCVNRNSYLVGEECTLALESGYYLTGGSILQLTCTGQGDMYTSGLVTVETTSVGESCTMLTSADVPPGTSAGDCYVSGGVLSGSSCTLALLAGWEIVSGGLTLTCTNGVFFTYPIARAMCAVPTSTTIVGAGNCTGSWMSIGSECTLGPVDDRYQLADGSTLVAKCIYAPDTSGTITATSAYLTSLSAEHCYAPTITGLDYSGYPAVITNGTSITVSTASSEQYFLEGIDTISCTSGVLSDPLPTVRTNAACSVLNMSSTAGLDQINCTVGATVTRGTVCAYSILPGWVPKAGFTQLFSMCIDDATWYPLPQMTRVAVGTACEWIPPTFSGSGLSLDTDNDNCTAPMQHGTTCTMILAPNYTLQPGSSLTVSCADGVASPPPVALAPCAVVVPRGCTWGTCNETIVDGASCVFDCPLGITGGSMTRTCDNGRFHGCEQLICLGLVAPIGFELGTCTQPIKVGTNCTLQLATGFRLVSGTLLRTCSSTALLSAQPSALRQCDAAILAPPIGAEFGPNSTTSCNRTAASGEACVLVRLPEYTVRTGALNLTCQNGTWSPSPTLDYTACSALLPVPVGTTIGTCNHTYVEGKHCTLGLLPSYTVSTGSLTLTCWNTSWLSVPLVVQSGCFILDSKPDGTTAGNCTAAAPPGATCTLDILPQWVLPTHDSLTLECNATFYWVTLPTPLLLPWLPLGAQIISPSPLVRRTGATVTYVLSFSPDITGLPLVVDLSSEWLLSCTPLLPITASGDPADTRPTWGDAYVKSSTTFDLDIPSYRLPVNATCTVSLVVIVVGSVGADGVSRVSPYAYPVTAANYSVMVEGLGPLRAIISGGRGRRERAVNEIILLDGSTSFDPEARSSLTSAEATALLSFEWKCEESSVGSGIPCSIAVDQDRLNSSVVLLEENTLTVGRVTAWTLTVRTADGSNRMASTSITLLTVPALPGDEVAPLVRIVDPPSTLDVSAPLRLYAAVARTSPTLPAQMNYSWTTDSPEVTALITDATTLAFTINTATLVVRGGEIAPPSVSYALTITVTVTDPYFGTSSAASVTLTVLAPPSVTPTGCNINSMGSSVAGAQSPLVVDCSPVALSTSTPLEFALMYSESTAATCWHVLTYPSAAAVLSVTLLPGSYFLRVLLSDAQTGATSMLDLSPAVTITTPSSLSSMDAECALEALRQTVLAETLAGMANSTAGIGVSSSIALIASIADDLSSLLPSPSVALQQSACAQATVAGLLISLSALAPAIRVDVWLGPAQLADAVDAISQLSAVWNASQLQTEQMNALVHASIQELDVNPTWLSSQQQCAVAATAAAVANVQVDCASLNLTESFARQLALTQAAIGVVGESLTAVGLDASIVTGDLVDALEIVGATNSSLDVHLAAGALASTRDRVRNTSEEFDSASSDADISVVVTAAQLTPIWAKSCRAATSSASGSVVSSVATINLLLSSGSRATLVQPIEITMPLDANATAKVRQELTIAQLACADVSDTAARTAAIDAVSTAGFMCAWWDEASSSYVMTDIAVIGPTTDGTRITCASMYLPAGDFAILYDQSQESAQRAAALLACEPIIEPTGVWWSAIFFALDLLLCLASIAQIARVVHATRWTYRFIIGQHAVLVLVALFRCVQTGVQAWMPQASLATSSAVVGMPWVFQGWLLTMLFFSWMQILDATSPRPRMGRLRIFKARHRIYYCNAFVSVMIVCILAGMPNASSTQIERLRRAAAGLSAVLLAPVVIALALYGRRLARKMMQRDASTAVARRLASTIAVFAVCILLSAAILFAGAVSASAFDSTGLRVVYLSADTISLACGFFFLWPTVHALVRTQQIGRTTSLIAQVQPSEELGAAPLDVDPDGHAEEEDDQEYGDMVPPDPADKYALAYGPYDHMHEVSVSSRLSSDEDDAPDVEPGERRLPSLSGGAVFARLAAPADTTSSLPPTNSWQHNRIHRSRPLLPLNHAVELQAARSLNHVLNSGHDRDLQTTSHAPLSLSHSHQLDLPGMTPMLEGISSADGAASVGEMKLEEA